MENAYGKTVKIRLYGMVHVCKGVAISSLCAVAFVALFAHSRWQLAVPYLFAALLVILSSRFGAESSIGGSLLGAAIFALYLFHPLHSLRVESDGERASLAWMILLSIALSYLLYPSRREL
jgi:K+-sensing histidine kinase KdpD